MRHYAIRVAIKVSVGFPEQTHTKEENRHDKIKCYAPTNTCTLAKEYIREKNTHAARDKHTQTRHDKRGRSTTHIGATLGALANVVA